MILLIDTSQETATTAIALDGMILISEENKITKEHATWLHTAIARMLEKKGLTLRDIKAVAVVAGPGSYTGVRVGMAAAKGFCYALKIPLITANTLRVMAESMKTTAKEKDALVCPLLDARRSEVFTALYDAEMEEILEPQALILDKNSFETWLNRKTVLFFGSGAEKWRQLCTAPNAIFETQIPTIQYFANLAQQDFLSGNWADPVYSEPIYLKEFFSY